jgi:hypothetical protein
MFLDVLRVDAIAGNGPVNVIANICHVAKLVDFIYDAFHVVNSFDVSCEIVCDSHRVDVPYVSVSVDVRVCLERHQLFLRFLRPVHTLTSSQ